LAADTRARRSLWNDAASNRSPVARSRPGPRGRIEYAARVECTPPNSPRDTRIRIVSTRHELRADGATVVLPVQSSSRLVHSWGIPAAVHIVQMHVLHARIDAPARWSFSGEGLLFHRCAALLIVGLLAGCGTAPVTGDFGGDAAASDASEADHPADVPGERATGDVMDVETRDACSRSLV
jgi:hypothetical protein